MLVGNSFQWPPPRTQEEQGPTASPIYINPNSRTSSPAPLNVASPAMNLQAQRNLSSPAMNSRASPTPRNISSPAMSSNTRNGSQFTSPTPGMNSNTTNGSQFASPTPGMNPNTMNGSQFASPTPGMNPNTTNGSQFTSPTPGMTSPSRSTIVSPSPIAQSPVPILKNQTQIPVQLSNTPNRNQHVQFTNQQNNQSNQNGQKEWSQTLNQNMAGAANNATDFTKNFLNQLGTPIPVTVNHNGAHNLHNPKPMETSPAFAANEPTPPSQDLPAVGPGQNVSAPRRGRGVLQQQKPGMRVPMCGNCDNQIR